jgi:hypothetical protein
VGERGKEVVVAPENFAQPLLAFAQALPEALPVCRFKRDHQGAPDRVVLPRREGVLVPAVLGRMDLVAAERPMAAEASQT